MTKRIAYSIALVITMLALLTGCSKRPDDETIAKDIQNKVAVDPDTKDSSVQVTANQGKVTLQGKVKTPAAQQKVEQIAKDEPGATGVDDQTMVEPAAMPAETMAPAPAPAPAPMAMEPPKPKPQPLVVPAGTALTVKLGQSLSSKTSQEGQTFTATMAQPVTVGGKRAIPAGSAVSGTVVSAKAKGKFKGEGELSLTLTSVAIGGRTYDIQTSPFSSTVKGKGKRTAVTTGGGAAGGALIGGLAGGGKGAGIGALIGAGAGLAGGALTGNKQVELPAESALTFRLSAPLTLPPGGE
jgi:hypothetical protein